MPEALAPSLAPQKEEKRGKGRQEGRKKGEKGKEQDKTILQLLNALKFQCFPILGTQLELLSILLMGHESSNSFWRQLLLLLRNYFIRSRKVDRDVLCFFGKITPFGIFYVYKHFASCFPIYSERYLTFLYLSFSLCKMQMIMVLAKKCLNSLKGRCYINTNYGLL